LFIEVHQHKGEKMKKGKLVNLAIGGLIISNGVFAIEKAIDKSEMENPNYSELVASVKENKKGVPSSDMNKVIKLLKFDWEFIEKFLDNPRKALAKFHLTNEEKKALMAKDLRGLMSLGVDQKNVAIAMSGTHRGGGGRMGF
jgi:hypothetical protein